MSEEEIYKMLLTENIEKFPLLNEIFAIRNNKFKINNYTIYVTGCISLDVINRAIEKVNLIDKLQKELKDSINARFELQRRIDKLQKDLENLKEVERQICCEELITKDKYQDILKENAELKKVVWEQKADKNKLINYIAIRENKTHEEVCKEFEV